MKQGLFVTFEGIDGCGKSTQIAACSQACQELGVDFVMTREPGGTVISEKIRELLLSAENKAMCDQCEVLLYFAARAQHVSEKIVPALRCGKIVLCDRFSEATIAYQGYGRGISLDDLHRMDEFARHGLVADITFVFDLPVSVAMQRIKNSGRIPDRLEASALDFHERVRAGYLELAARHPHRIIVLAAERSRQEISFEVRTRFMELLNRQKPG